jgi:hypothetical protein
MARKWRPQSGHSWQDKETKPRQGLAIFCSAAGRAPCKIRRHPEPTLGLLDGSMHGAGTDLDVAVQQGSNLFQETVAALDGKRPGSSEDSGQLVVGEADRRHGTPIGLRNASAERYRGAV